VDSPRSMMRQPPFKIGAVSLSAERIVERGRR
jgi:hypothetical protein